MGVSSSLLPVLSRAARTMRNIPGGSSLVDGGALVFGGHRVAPLDPYGIRANEGLKVTPKYLDFFVRRLRTLGYAFVSLDDLVEAVLSGRKTQGLAALTFDDGYRDNMERALPILEKLKTPFTVYALCGLKSRMAFFWWLALEAFLRARSCIRFSDGREISCGTPRERERVFMDVRKMVLERARRDARSFLLGLLPGFDSALPAGMADKHVMGEADLRLLSRSSLATIGCHTMTHPNLGTLTEREAYGELSESKVCLEKTIGKEIRHIAFPFGDRAEAGKREYSLASRAGFVTAATMVAGSIARGDADCLLRLPRIPIREGADPLDLVAENRARVWMTRARGLLRV